MVTADVKMKTIDNRVAAVGTGRALRSHPQKRPATSATRAGSARPSNAVSESPLCRRSAFRVLTP